MPAPKLSDKIEAIEAKLESLGPLAFAKKIVPKDPQCIGNVLKTLELDEPFVDCIITTNPLAPITWLSMSRAEEGILQVKFGKTTTIKAIYLVQQ